MLNPAIDVLAHVNDPAINPQNEDKPAKLGVGALEPGDKGLGWEMCECCPCPETNKPPGPGPGGPVPQPQEPEVIIVPGESEDPPEFFDIPITTPPIRTTTTERVTTTTVTTGTTPRLPTTICPPDSKGGPRCNVLKW